MSRYFSINQALICMRAGLVMALLGLLPHIAFAEEDANACIKFVPPTTDVSLKKASKISEDFFDGLDGKTIRSIEYKSVDIFDEENPDENNSLYLFLNDLHTNTRVKVIESQLLFKLGDAIDTSAIHESERILRTRKYLTNAYILPSFICGDQVDVLVVTQDAWALEPQFSFSRKSGSNQTGYGLSDGNIFGTGNALTIAYSENKLRKGISYDFVNPHFMNKQIAVRLFYEDTDDGRNGVIDVARPFYSLDTPWAAGVHLEDTSLVDVIRSGDEVINEFNHQTLIDEVFLGKATDITSDYTQRWLMGFTNEEQKFLSTIKTLFAIPLDNKAAYPWLEYQYSEKKFGVYKNVNQIQRPEDIALGQNFSFRLGYGGKRFDNQDGIIRFKSEYINIIDLREKHIFEYGVMLNGREHLQLKGMDSTILGLQMSYNYFKDDKNRWYSRIAYDVGQDLAQYEELTVGDLTGLRGYPTDYVRGKKRYVFTLERRYFSDIHLFNLLRMGGVAFFDMGKAWGFENKESPLLSNVGIGLRFSSTKVRIGNVVHIDIAMPTTAKEGISKYQLTIAAESKF